MRILYLALAIFFLQGCSSTKDVDLSYQEAKSMPGYGFIEFDFNDSTITKKGYDGLKSYTIQYVKDNKSLFVNIKNMDQNGGVFHAYIPYYKGYQFRNISSGWVEFTCEYCSSPVVREFVNVYSTSAVGGSWCEETIYKNKKSFDYTDGCKKESQEKNGKGLYNSFMGHVYITPQFNDNHQTFTNRAPSGHQSAGS
ncbi:Uncharacterised protein [Yersinia mollaretii]|uniref:hypothetical protein n=1 Tax=Yersinia mollaretii TaxID=33060 RepID=UPI0005DFECF5|nr:hypothetical protein [Yersinia mollaretii]CNJ86931.1 Uncharacterised protein [Yersinia mollaretii]